MATRDNIVELYVGYFNRAPDPEGLNYWFQQIESGEMTLAEIATSFSVQPEATSTYPFLRFPEIVSPEAFLTQVYLNLFNREPDEAGLEYWVGELAGGMAVGEAIVNIISGAQNTEDGQDLTTLENKVEAGFNWTTSVAGVPGFEYFSTDADGNLVPNAGPAAAAKQVIADVDDTPESVEAAAEFTADFVSSLGDGGEVPTGGTTQSLTVGADMLIGGTGNDTFEARVVQNDNGEQTNQLGSGDLIIGGGGFDTLMAKVQVASALNASPSSAIAPETNSVEDIQITALTLDNAGFFFGESRFFDGVSAAEVYDLFGFGVEVTLNAKFMEGVDRFGSIDSDADLLITNANTLTSSGEYEDRRNTAEMTVRMEKTAGLTIVDEEISDFPNDFFDNDGFFEDPADFTVLFDQDYLISGQASEGQADFFLLDQDAELDLITTPNSREGRLDIIDRSGITFDVEGVTYTLQFAPSFLDEDNVDEVNTHQEFFQRLLDVLNDTEETGARLQLRDELNAIQPGAGDSAIANLPPEGLVQLVFNDTFANPPFDSLIPDPDRPGEFLNVTALNDGTNSNLIPAITVETINGEPIEARGFITPPGSSGDFNVFGRSGERDFTEQLPITIDVELLKVGRAQEGGALTIGSMDTGSRDWQDVEGGPGIEVFNIVVEGDETQDSSLSLIQSTNNALKTINLTSAEGSLASIEIGNGFSNGRFGWGEGIYDVQTFNAAEFQNDIWLTAVIGDTVLGKYFDRTDTQVDSDDDDVVFNYDFGVGDDYFAMLFDADAFDDDGNITQEDFEFNADMGDGDDVVFMENDQSADVFNARTFDWYVSHIVDKDDEASTKLNNAGSGVNVDLGDGNDFMQARGATAYNIVAGTGNDVIFTDDSSGDAVWVFNAFDNDEDTPFTQPEIIATNIANMTLTVDYLGLSSTVNVGTTAGSRTGERLTDLDIVQSIKRAINDDAVLSELLVAEDSAGRALNVYAFGDGEVLGTDLTISVGNSSATLTQAQIDGGAQFFLDGSGNQALGFLRSDGSAIPTDFDDTTIQDGRWDPSGLSDSGDDSFQANNNTVEGGLGDDIIVLSTSASGLGEFAGGSTETVVINGLFGNDTLINFKAATNPMGPINEVLTFGDYENQGYDIFDVTGVLGNNLVQGVYNDTTADADDAVAAAGGVATLNNFWVFITNDSPLDANPATTRAQELQTYYNSLDTAGTGNADHLHIAVDGNNVGDFYRVTNGAGNTDVTVTFLGSIEMAQYDDLGKSALGNWSGLDLDNFTPLTQTELFDVI